MQIKNVKVYGLEESIIRSGYPMQVGEPEDLDDLVETWDPEMDDAKSVLRASKLANTPIGSGHDNWLKGVIVSFDLQYPEYFSPQLQRYHWIDIVSSQSKMHKLTSNKKLINSCNDYVLNSHADDIDELIEAYNLNEFPYTTSDVWPIVNSKEECFRYIISNLPSGYLKWMGISTNYLQLKTIYNQRCKHKHKLKEWQEFGEFIKTLPMSELITDNK